MDAEGEAAELSLSSPSSVSLAADGSLVVLADGCYVGDTLKSAGVEVVDTTTGVSLAAYVSKTSDFLGRLILTGAKDALLGTFDICLAQSRTDAERFAVLGCRSVITTGNLKLDVPAPPADFPNVPDVVAMPVFQGVADGQDAAGDLTGRIGRAGLAGLDVPVG